MEKKREFQLTKKRTIYLTKKKGKKIFFFTRLTHNTSHLLSIP